MRVPLSLLGQGSSITPSRKRAHRAVWRNPVSPTDPEIVAKLRKYGFRIVGSLDTGYGLVTTIYREADSVLFEGYQATVAMDAFVDQVRKKRSRHVFEYLSSEPVASTECVTDENVHVVWHDMVEQRNLALFINSAGDMKYCNLAILPGERPNTAVFKNTKVMYPGDEVLDCFMIEGNDLDNVYRCAF